MAYAAPSLEARVRIPALCTMESKLTSECLKGLLQGIKCISQGLYAQHRSNRGIIGSLCPGYLRWRVSLIDILSFSDEHD